MAKKVVVCGSYLHGDDAISLIVAKTLSKKFPDIIIAENEPENFIRLGDEIMLIDAIPCKNKRLVGDVRIVDVGLLKEKRSSHDFLSLLLRKINAKVVGIFVNEKHIGFRIGISNDLKKKLPYIVNKVEVFLHEFFEMGDKKKSKTRINTGQS